MAGAAGWTWHPIEPPPAPETLAVPELRAFQSLWRRQRARLEDSGALEPFNERMARLWSIETGILERLYNVSDGITVTLVEQGFEAALIPHGEASLPAEQLVEILETQRDGLDMVMDVVTGQRRLTTGWIKELHHLLTRHQHTTEALDQFGTRIEVRLLKGEYKRTANNPSRRDDGAIHEYCPPEHVASEMDRLVDIHASLPDVYPEVRSAWLHHAFTQIHPFQDGNGRVARALASVDMVRAGLFPVLVERSMRDRYISALERADHGELRPLVDLFAECETRVLTRAISEAESIVQPVEGMEAVLAAARAKREARADRDGEERAVLTDRMQALVRTSKPDLDRLLAEVRAKVPGVTGFVKLSATDAEHRWKDRQVIELGRAGNYWVDLHEPRRWLMLRLEDGGRTDIVLATHFIGRPSPGAGLAVCYLEHRLPKASVSGEELAAITELPIKVIGEPLLLAADEQEEEQRRRFGRWRDESILAAVARWTQYL